MFHYPFRAMGCQMKVLIDTTTDATMAANLVADSFQQWEHTLSRFDPQSELNGLMHAPDRWQTISPVLWDVLLAAAWAYRHTQGIIDPTIRSTLEAHGYNTTYSAIIPGSSPTSYRKSDWERVQIDSTQARVLIPHGVTLDLAGVAKSWAAQMAIQQLWEYPAVAIDAAGDICFRGIPAEYGAWPIGIEPLSGYVETPMLALRDCAIATSGIDKRSWKQQDGTRAHHIIDPRTGLPAQSDVVRASVIAPTILEADVAARTLVILGYAEGMRWLAGIPNHACLMHLADGTTKTDARWNDYLWVESPS
jgi:thiamine biosynthesis lipoprotein